MMLQLNPTVPLDTPKGKAMAHFLIDYGQEHHLMWVTFIEATGECWTFENPQVRLQGNITMGTKSNAKVQGLGEVKGDGGNGQHCDKKGL